MSETLAVFGATGTQGKSVIDHVLHDPELSQKYAVRAVVRDVESDKAKALKEKNVQVVHGDFSEPASLKGALDGVRVVFAIMLSSFTPDDVENEYANGKAMVDATVAQGVEYLIFSTLPSPSQISEGKYTGIHELEAKAKVEQYIRGRPIRSAFYSPSFFMQSFPASPYVVPRPAGDGSWVFGMHLAPTSRIPLIDAVADTGKFVGAILADREKFEGETVRGAAGSYSLEEVAAAMSKATGKTVRYQQTSVEDFRDILTYGKDVWPAAFSYFQEFGMFGPGSEKLIAWSQRNARGSLTTLDEYLDAHPFRLE